MTSRRLSADQINHDQNVKNKLILTREDYLQNDDAMPVMTYSTFGRLLVYDALNEYIFDNIKAFVFDECHSLVMDEYNEMNKAALAWIKHLLVYTDKLVIGLTATPKIFQHYYENDAAFNYVNEPFYAYRAQHLILMDWKSLPSWINQTGGRTLVMCTTKKACYELASAIQKPSFILLGVNDRTQEMSEMELRIAKEQSLPLTDANGNHIDVLIGTSTLREGFTLTKDSDVQNVVSCYGSSDNVIQLCGRCRYNVKNLVVCDGLYQNTRYGLSYARNEVTRFRDFLAGDHGNGWFEKIESVVAEPMDSLEVYKSDGSHPQIPLLKYLESEHLLDSWIPAGSAIAKQIVEKAYELKVLGPGKRRNFYSMNALLNAMKTWKGCNIQKERRIHDKQRSICYKICLN